MARATRGRRFLISSVASVLAVGGLATFPVQASSTTTALGPRSLARAQAIRTELDARYRVVPGRGLAVTEATSTSVVESFTLATPDFLEMRVLPAGNGIWYAICPVRATCPYPARRFARTAGDLAPRRLALELALQTFLETTVDVIAVSLPTPRFIAFVVERRELAREVDIPTLAGALGGEPSRTLSGSLERTVERVTRPRVFRFVALEPTPSGREAWVGVPRWAGVTS